MTKFCVECGSEINAKAELCPDCGVRQPALDGDETDHSIPFGAYGLVNVTLGALSLIFFPIVFGPIAILAGVQVSRHYDTKLGIAMVAWGLFAMIVGMIIGALYWSGAL